MKKIIFILSIFITLNSFSQELKIEKVTCNFYVYTTFNLYKGELVSANAMYVLTSEGAILFDTPWDSTQYEPLIDSIWIRHHQKIIMVIGTHSHNDRSAGFSFFQKKGIATYAIALTDSFLVKDHHAPSTNILQPDQKFNIGNESFEVYFPGAGHTLDNIVAWFPKEKLLYGGCFIKSAEATDLGYIKESDTKEWPKSIERIKKKFGKPAYVISGHDDWHDASSLDHTLQLLTEFNKQ